jgi:hypothetical protein
MSTEIKSDIAMEWAGVPIVRTETVRCNAESLRRALVSASSAARHISDDKVSEIVSNLSKESLERLHKILKGS